MTPHLVKPPQSRYRSKTATGTRSYLEDVTPEDIRRARRAAAAGRPAHLFRVLAHFLQLDDEIPAALQSLASAVIQETPEAVVLDETEEAKRQRDYLAAMLDELDTVALLETLLLGHYYGVRAAEVVPGTLTVGGRLYQAPVTWEELPQEWIYGDAEREGAPRTLYVGAAPYHTYEPGSVLLYTAGKLGSYADIDFTRLGCGLACSRFATFAYYNIEDWAALNEAFGTPAVIGTLLQGWNEADKKLLENAVFNLGSDSRAIVTEKTKLDLVPPTSDGGATYDSFLARCAKARANIIKSESLTDNMGDRGSYAAMVTTNGIRLDVAKGIARRLERLLNRRLVRPWLARNFTRPLAAIRLQVAAIEDGAKKASIFRAAQQMGFPVSKTQIAEELGLTIAEGDDVLSRRLTNPFS